MPWADFRLETEADDSKVFFSDFQEGNATIFCSLEKLFNDGLFGLFVVVGPRGKSLSKITPKHRFIEESVDQSLG